MQGDELQGFPSIGVNMVDAGDKHRQLNIELSLAME
jgi:hypothetical protein